MRNTEVHRSTGELEFGDALRALSQPTRRHVLLALYDRDPGGTVAFDVTDCEAGSVEATREAIALYHRHLPRLDQDGFVDWNREEGTVTRGENFDAIASLIALLEEHRDDLPGDWPE